MKLKKRWSREVLFAKWVDCTDNRLWSDRGGFYGPRLLLRCNVQPIRNSVFSGSTAHINDSVIYEPYGADVNGRYHVYMEETGGIELGDGVFLFADGSDEPDFAVSNIDRWRSHVRLTVKRL